MILAVRGCYRVVVPADWAVGDDSDGMASLEPVVAPRAAVTISVFSTDAHRAARPEAALRVARGAADSDGWTNVTPGGLTRVRSFRQDRCFVDLRSSERWMFFGALELRGRLVLASVNAAPDEVEQFEAGRTIVTSIAPWSRFG